VQFHEQAPSIRRGVCQANSGDVVEIQLGVILMCFSGVVRIRVTASRGCVRSAALGSSVS
jgi:hypothetical protein